MHSREYMDSSEIESMKRDMSVKVHDIFDNFEEHNNRLPTMEEFRSIFHDCADNYLGPLDKQIVDGINANLERQRIREQQLWDAVNELESEERVRRDAE